MHLQMTHDHRLANQKYNTTVISTGNTTPDIESGRRSHSPSSTKMKEMEMLMEGSISPGGYVGPTSTGGDVGAVPAVVA